MCNHTSPELPVHFSEISHSLIDSLQTVPLALYCKSKKKQQQQQRYLMWLQFIVRVSGHLTVRAADILVAANSSRY